MVNKNILKLALSRSFSKDSAYPGLWQEKNPYIGQCAVSSLIVQDYLGGKIAKINLDNLDISHYFNLINSEIIDFTKEQFSPNYQLDYSNHKIKNRSTIKGSQIKERYNHLRNQANSYLKDFENLQNSIENCKKCSFVEHLKGPIIKVGSNTKILFIGEAPAPNGWRKSGKAFYTPGNKLLPTGKNLQKMLNILDIKLNDITYTEIIKCKPNQRKDLKKACQHCKKFLLKQLKLIKPKIIIPIGSLASTSLIKFLQKEEKEFKKIKGKTFNVNNYLILPLQHPSPANPYGLKFNIPILKKFIKSKKYQKRTNLNTFINQN